MRTALFLLFCLIAVTPPVGAARIAGLVVDSSGAPVPNAIVVIAGRSVVTGDNGRFELPDGPEGETMVQVSAAGFAPTTVRLTGGSEARVILQPAPLLEAVVVTAPRGVERLSTASSATVVTPPNCSIRPAAPSTISCAAHPGSACSAARRRASRTRRPRA
jgi:hypothetical protein